ncbi:hypothetical protein OO012_10410 [Rhodobacteraceae bacterium KMM 6894]|nr:hypothetical protein [Rhodobacteraceae bacterium KMM 6894]
MPRLPSRLVAIACLALMLCLSGPSAQAQSEVTRSDLIRMLGRLYDDLPIREDLMSLGFRGENLDLAVEQAKRVLRDPDVAGYVADRVLALQSGTAPPPTRAAEGLLWGLMDRGISHLPLRDLRYYYVVEQAVLKAMSPRNCGLAVRERMSPERLADETARIAARLNTPALRTYYDIQLRAAQLGATRPQLKMSTARIEAAEQSIFEALARLIASRDDAEKLMRTFSRLDNADNRSACTAGRAFIDAVLSLEGKALHEALIYLSLP